MRQNIAPYRQFDNADQKRVASGTHTMTSLPRAGSARTFIAYYAATAIFLLLDFVIGINVRVTFLAEAPGWRFLYYLFCFACLGLIVWRPALSTLVATLESLLTLCALIISTALRVVIVSDGMIEQGRGFVSINELVNFLISGAIVYFAFWRGMQSLRGQSGPREP